ncbi:hypothetical protein E4U10_003491 [Claviceps purpurea]|nr:hypothetical protein E4U10_003491 [Claviceps purpurea]
MEMASASTILELRKLQPASHPAGCWSVVTGGWQVATAGDTWGRCRYCSGPAVQLALGSWQLAVGKCTPLSHAIVARHCRTPCHDNFPMLHVAAQAPPTIAKYSSHHHDSRFTNAPPTIAKDSSQPHTVLCHVRVPLAAWQEVLPGALSSVDSHGGPVRPALEKYAPQNLASASVQDTGRTQVDWTR